MIIITTQSKTSAFFLGKRDSVILHIYLPLPLSQSMLISQMVKSDI